MTGYQAGVYPDRHEIAILFGGRLQALCWKNPVDILFRNNDGSRAINGKN
jgi:hypothetical protein